MTGEQLAAENFLDALAQHRPVVLADLEMPSQIEQGPLANFVAEAFGTHEAVGKVGGAGCGGTGLDAANEHTGTIAGVGGGNIFTLFITYYDTTLTSTTRYNELRAKTGKIRAN